MGSAPAARPGGLPTPHSFHACSLHPLLGQLTEPPPGGTHLPSSNRIRLTILFWDHPEACHRSTISLTSPGQLSWITLTTCTSTLSSDPERPPRPRAPWLCLGSHPLLPGPSLSCPLQRHQELPPAPDRLSALSWGSLRGVSWKTQEVPVGPPSCSTVASTCLLTSSL